MPLFVFPIRAPNKGPRFPYITSQRLNVLLVLIDALFLTTLQFSQLLGDCSPGHFYYLYLQSLPQN